MSPRRLLMRSRGYVIAIVLIASIVLLQVAATIVGVVLASRQLNEAALDTYGYVGDLTEERVARYAESARDVVTATALQIGDAGDALARDALAKSMYQRLERETTVRGLYVGWPDGEYLVLRRTGGGYTEAYGDEDTAHAIQRDSRFEPLGEVAGLIDYDPTVRPWYRAAEDRRSLTWTDPYIEYDTSNTLVSAAQAARDGGDVVAVVGADLSLDALSTVLDDLPYGDGAEAFVVSPDQAVIASPSHYTERLQEIAATTGEVPTLSDLGFDETSPPPRPNSTTFTSAGSAILLDRTFPAEEGLDWVIHISADSSQLSSGLGGLGTTLWWITAISLSLLVGAAIFAWRVRHPLRRLRERATTDPLTGLNNRSEFGRRGGRIVSMAASRGDRIMVTTLDLDGFKALNDTHGHDVGDRALIAVGLALRAGVREGDVVGRFGGDEFVTIQVLRRSDSARSVADRVRAEIERELHTRVEGAEQVGVTMGIAEAVDGEADLPTLLKRADTALIRGKAVRKGAVYNGNGSDGRALGDDRGREPRTTGD